MQPKKYHNPMIALLNVELELKAEKDNAEIRVHTVEVGPPAGSGMNTGSILGQSRGPSWSSWASSVSQAPYGLLSPPVPLSVGV